MILTENHTGLIATTKLTNTRVGLEKDHTHIREQLAQRIAELNQFVYHVSHDLMSPLCSIRGLLNLLAKERPVGHQQYLSLIEDRIEHLNTFTSEILAYSKNLNLELSCEPLKCHQLIRNSYQKYQEIYPNLNIKLNTFIGNGPFHSDPNRLSNIFNVLFSNAFQFADAEKPNQHIDLSLFSENSSLVIKFLDNGLGIPNEIRPSVMDIFFRGSTASKGNGLGLYILKQAVDKLQGTVTIESKESLYTEFIIRLPLN